MMQLWYAPTSPFARKTLITAHELGLDDRLQLIEVDPWTDERLRQLNPLAKVPTLVLETGEVFFESAVICEYFDSLSQASRLLPRLGSARWAALLKQALADGGAAAAGRLYAEEQKDLAQRSASMLERFRRAIDGALDALERHGVDAALSTLGDIAAVAFLGYLDFRWPDRDWRGPRPELAQALATAQHRPSLARTIHRLIAS